MKLLSDDHEHVQRIIYATFNRLGGIEKGMVAVFSRKPLDYYINP